MDTPLVSVITCTNRRPLFLRKAIELFCAQTWPNKEMVIMNDGDPADVPSTEGLPIRHVWTSGYEGMTRKQRWAFEIARGDLLAYWDDDDYFAPNRLQRQATAILAGKAEATGFPIDLIASTSPAGFWRWKKQTVSDWERKNEPVKPPGYAVPFHDGSAMWKKSFVSGLPECIREGWQLGFLDEIRKRGARLLALPNFGSFVYVRHGGNAWDFRTEDKCESAERPDWLPDEMVTFWNNPLPSLQATAALKGRSKDHNGI